MPLLDIIKFKMGALEKKGVVIKLLWLVVLKICFEKLATMSFCVVKAMHS